MHSLTASERMRGKKWLASNLNVQVGKAIILVGRKENVKCDQVNLIEIRKRKEFLVKLSTLKLKVAH